MNVKHQKQENVNQHTLTPESLKQYPGLEELCDSDAQAIIESLTVLAQASYELFIQRQG